jgi:hypothetical protein
MSDSLSSIEQQINIIPEISFEADQKAIEESQI